jgi:hypothetical protein
VLPLAALATAATWMHGGMHLPITMRACQVHIGSGLVVTYLLWGALLDLFNTLQAGARYQGKPLRGLRELQEWARQSRREWRCPVRYSDSDYTSNHGTKARHMWHGAVSNRCVTARGQTVAEVAVLLCRWILPWWLWAIYVHTSRITRSREVHPEQRRDTSQETRLMHGNKIGNRGEATVKLEVLNSSNKCCVQRGVYNASWGVVGEYAYDAVCCGAQLSVKAAKFKACGVW